MKMISTSAVLAMALFSLVVLFPVSAGAEENSAEYAAISPPDQFGLPEIIKGLSLSGCYAALTKDGAEPKKLFRVVGFDESSPNPSLLWIRLADGTRLRLISLPHDGQEREVRIAGEVVYHIFHQPQGLMIWFAMNQMEEKDFKLEELIAQRGKSVSGF